MISILRTDYQEEKHGRSQQHLVNYWGQHMEINTHGFFFFFLIGFSNSKSSPYVEIEAMRPPLKGNL